MPAPSSARDKSGKLETILTRFGGEPAIRIQEQSNRPRYKRLAWRHTESLWSTAMPRAVSMLIADDSTVTQEILSEAVHLSKLPVRLTVTDNGRDCLTLLNGANVDLAFIDVHMPELSGTEAFWSAKKIGIKTFVTLMSDR